MSTPMDVIREALALGYRWEPRGPLSNRWKFHPERRGTTRETHAAPPHTVTVAQAAARCGLSAWTMYWHIRQGHCPALRACYPTRIAERDLTAFQAQRRRRRYAPH